MKSRLFVFVATLAIALASLAQTATPTAPSTAASPDTKACACCNHDKAESGSKATCAGCCKDGKCPMMSGSHAGMKCPMMANDKKMADGKTCCSSNKCPMHAKDGKGSGCCCGNIDEKRAGM